jgi:uncharacterized membrane protein YjjB (DUF3815 family)
VVIGITISGADPAELYVAEPVDIPVWIPYAGILVYGIGVWLNQAMRPRDVPWSLLTLYATWLAQQIAVGPFGVLVGGFAGGLVLSVVSLLIGGSPDRPPGKVISQSGFWLLVPGSVGYEGLARLLGADPAGLQTLIEMIGLMTAIALGYLVGGAIVLRRKSVPVLGP